MQAEDKEILLLTLLFIQVMFGYRVFSPGCVFVNCNRSLPVLIPFKFPFRKKYEQWAKTYSRSCRASIPKLLKMRVLVVYMVFLSCSAWTSLLLYGFYTEYPVRPLLILYTL